MTVETLRETGIQMWCHHCWLIWMSFGVKTENKRHSRRIWKFCCLHEKRNELKIVVNEETGAIKEKPHTFPWDKRELARPQAPLGQRYEMTRSCERVFLERKEPLGYSVCNGPHRGIFPQVLPPRYSRATATKVQDDHAGGGPWPHPWGTHLVGTQNAGVMRLLRLLRPLRMCLKWVVSAERLSEYGEWSCDVGPKLQGTLGSGEIPEMWSIFW